jgi:nucleotide-binding universal stress UspA family protein
MTQSILVLYDFTRVADYALHHAIISCKNLNLSLCLLHIIHSPKITLEKLDESTKQRKESKITDQIKKVCEKLKADHNMEVNYLVRHGNIFTDMANFEKEINAKLIIMGTHGSKGIQQFIGSNVVRVIACSGTSFIVVQKNMNENGYKKIVVPVDYNNEIIGLKKWLDIMVKQHHSTVYLFNNTRPNPTIQELINKNSENIVQALQLQNVRHSVKQSIISKETFAQQIITYANGIGADIIMIISNQSKGLGDFFLVQYMQKIIMNPFNIPVMCVNPESHES